MKLEFKFTKENLKKAEEILAKYPKTREKSSILPLLDLAQRQAGGWLPQYVIEYVADFIKIPYIQAFEVASFYTMFNLKPVGTYHIQVCTTTPCWLRGSAEIVETCKNKLKIDVGETTKDGKFTLSEVECLGACINAPIIQINDDYHETLTPELTMEIIDKFTSKKR